MSMLTTQDMFSVEEMTDAVNKLPLMPMRLGSVFEERSVRTTSVPLDIQNGRITLVENQDRREPPQSMASGRNARKLLTLQTAHLPLQDVVLPDDVQNVRAFGSTEPANMATVINDRLLTLKRNVEMTREYHRLGAVKGVVMDADGSTSLLNLFDAFGVTKKTQSITFPSTDSIASNPVLEGITAAKRKLEAGMGGSPYSYVACAVGKTFWDKLTGHKLVREYWEDWLAKQALFGDNDWRKSGFYYGGVLFYEASESVGGVTLVADAKGHMYPVGQGVFLSYNAPANWAETVNTYGLPMYSRIDPIPNGRGYTIEVQSNPLTICTYPEALVELTAA